MEGAGGGTLITLRKQGTPLLAPTERYWEKKAVFNPGALYLKGRVYILYRALSPDLVSSIGLAVSGNGVDIDERLEEPVYVPRYDFEKRHGIREQYTGVEDPRVTLIDNYVYMTYTAVSDSLPYVRVALTRIRVKDFLKERWERWSRPFLISEPAVWDKDAAFVRVSDGLYLFYHRIEPHMWVSFYHTRFPEQEGWKLGIPFYKRGRTPWESVKVGLGAPPVRTEHGWLLIYHGIGEDRHYRAGVMLLDEEEPWNVVSVLDNPVLEPELPFEKEGLTSHVVFPTGVVILGDELFVYYGAADKYVALAVANIDDILGALVK